MGIAEQNMTAVAAGLAKDFSSGSVRALKIGSCARKSILVATACSPVVYFNIKLKL